LTWDKNLRPAWALGDNELSCGRRFGPSFSRLSLLSRLTPTISSCPMELAVSLAAGRCAYHNRLRPNQTLVS
jgi:hypothetical protein